MNDPTVLLNRLKLNDLQKFTREAIKREKLATFELLEYMREVDRRMAWQVWGYESLWKFLVTEGYSESGASERVQALRLLQKLPEAHESLRSGDLPLTTAAKVARFLRREAKEHGHHFSRTDMLKLVSQCAGKNKKQVDQIFEQAVLRDDPTRTMPEKESSLEISVSPSFDAKIKRMREIRGHDFSLEYLLEMAVDAWLVKNDPIVKYQAKKTVATVKQKRSSSNFCGKSAEQHTARGEDCGICMKDTNWDGSDRSPSSKKSRYIPALTRALVFRRDEFKCTQCDSIQFLQIDHIKKFSEKGGHEPENLRILCRNCNFAREKANTIALRVSFGTRSSGKMIGGGK